MNRTLSVSEAKMRVDNIREMMRNNGFDAVLVGTNANLYYLTGGVFSGYVYIPAEGEALQFVRRPVDKKGDGMCISASRSRLLNIWARTVCQHLGNWRLNSTASRIPTLCAARKHSAWSRLATLATVGASAFGEVRF